MDKLLFQTRFFFKLSELQKLLLMPAIWKLVAYMKFSICVDDSRFLCHVLGIWGAANDNEKNFPHEIFPFSVAPYCCCWLPSSNVRVLG